MIKQTVIICNKLGLHARAAAKFVSHASHYGCHIDIVKDDKTVNGKSIMGVMMLAAARGTELELIISGEDEKEAMNDLVNLINNKFGEDK